MGYAADLVVEEAQQQRQRETGHAAAREAAENDLGRNRRDRHRSHPGRVRDLTFRLLACFAGGFVDVGFLKFGQDRIENRLLAADLAFQHGGPREQDTAGCGEPALVVKGLRGLPFPCD